MLIYWTDLEVGDKLRFNKNYVEDVLLNRYSYNSSEI
jgi:hypothetical protein